MELNQYILLPGQCEDAFRTYQQILGGEITLMLKHAGTPGSEHMPPDWQDKIMHVCLEFGGCKLMGSDAPADRIKPMGGFAIQVATGSVAATERVFAALAEGGEITVPLHQPFWSERFTAAVRTTGLIATTLFDGATNGGRFHAYVADTLAPVLQPGDTVILDNLSAHKVASIREAIEAVGARLLYLPAYSPDLNPIEQIFAKLKALLRTAAAQTVPDLWDAIRHALTRFTPQECRNCISAAGYEDDVAVAT